MTVIENNNVTFHCNATGNPRPNITWIKDGSLTVLHQGETYSIVNIQRQAAGDYTCTAWNGLGELTNATATVTVHCKFWKTVFWFSKYFILSTIQREFEQLLVNQTTFP